MENKIEYHASSEEAKAAWFEYIRKNPKGKPSVLSFVAGYNAAKKELEEVPKSQFTAHCKQCGHDICEC